MTHGECVRRWMFGTDNRGWSELCCMQGAIICGIAITTIISWIPGHSASYLGPGSNLPGKAMPCLPPHPPPLFLFFSVFWTTQPP